MRQLMFSFTVRRKRKGQFFIIAAVIIGMILFTVSRLLITTPVNEFDLTTGVPTHNSIVSFVDSLDDLSKAEQDTALSVAEDWYDRYGFSFQIPTTLQQGAGADVSGNGHDATILGATLVDGKESLGLSFDGRDSAIIPDDAQFDQTNSFSIAGWYTSQEAVDGTTASGDWWNDSFDLRRQVTFDQWTGTGTQNLTNFPALIELDTSNFNYSNALANGHDLRFVDSDGSTVLDYERAQWNPGGTSYVWVEVPQLENTGDDSIWLYYDNSSTVTDGQNVTGTWNGQQLAGGWHFDNVTEGNVFGHASDRTTSGSLSNTNTWETYASDSITTRDSILMVKSDLTVTPANHDALQSRIMVDGEQKVDAHDDDDNPNTIRESLNLFWIGEVDAGTHSVSGDWRSSDSTEWSIDEARVDVIELNPAKTDFQFGSTSGGSVGTNWETKVSKTITVDADNNVLEMRGLWTGQTGNNQDQFARILLDGNEVSWSKGATSNGNDDADVSVVAAREVSAGSHTVQLQVKAESSSTHYDSYLGVIEHKGSDVVLASDRQQSGSTGSSSWTDFNSLNIDAQNSLLMTDFQYSLDTGNNERWEGRILVDGEEVGWSAHGNSDNNLHSTVHAHGLTTVIDSVSSVTGQWKTTESGSVSSSNLVAIALPLSTTPDHSGNENTGNLIQNPLRTSDCQVGSCFAFDGSDDYVGYGDILNLGEVTVSALIKANDPGASGEQKIVSGGFANKGNGASGYHLFVQGNGDTIAEIATSEGKNYYAGNKKDPVSSDEWHHLTLTYNSSRLQIYRNGELLDENATPSAQIYHGKGGEFFIGRESWEFDEFFNGTIDEVRISNVSRSAAWINASYQTQQNPQDFAKIGDSETQSSSVNTSAVTAGDLFFKDEAYGIRAISGRLYGYIGNSSPVSVPMQGDWQHIVFTFDRFANDTQAHLYVNGSLADSGDYSGFAPTSDSDVRMGERFEGILDEIYFYNRALSPAEVSEQYQGNITITSGLIAHYPFIQGCVDISTESVQVAAEETLC